MTKSFVFSIRLPFDEAQLEIPDQDKTDPFEKQPQGFINNNPAKNNPNARGKSGGGNRKSGGGNRKSGGAQSNGSSRKQTSRRTQQSESSSSNR